MEKALRPISLAGTELTGARRVCALFHSEEEEYEVLMPFIRDGFEAGDKAVHLVNPEQRAEHLQRLSSAGIDTDVSIQRGQLDVRSSTETYLRDSDFDQERMLQVFSEFAEDSSKPGARANRFVCRMDWAALGRTHVDNLIEFESRVNHIWRSSGDAVVCAYRLDQFSGDAVIDIVRTHPFVIIGGVLRQNPFFVPPEQFLPELRARRRTEKLRRTGA